MDELISVERWFSDVLDRYETEIEARSLSVHLDVEEGARVARHPAFEDGVSRLIHFVLETVPNGCEIYLAANRPVAPVSSVGSVEVTIRWQVAGVEDRSSDTVVPLHPIASDARSLANSLTARGLRDAFRAAGAGFSIEFLRTGRELMARVTR